MWPLIAAGIVVAILLSSKKKKSGDVDWSKAEKEKVVRATGYRNGEAFPLVLEAIPGGQRGFLLLETKTAVAFRSMSAAAKADGVELVPNSGFRSMAEQTALYNLTPGQRERFGVGQQVAKPGFSNHQSGIAVDIQTAKDPKVSPWLITNAARFGFANTVPAEPWHWEHVA